MEKESKVLILGAMDEEIETLVQNLESVTKEEWNGFLLHFGTLEGSEVIVCKSGIGKVFASIITQRLLDTFKISHVMFTGVAGAIAPELNPGDIVLGEQLIHHDFDVKALGFDIGHIPFTDYRFFAANKELLEKAKQVAADDHTVTTGIIGTGDQFVTDKTGLDQLGLACVDMEGCAVAQVCTVNNIPFLVIRIISDKADGSADIDFAANLPLFAKHSIELIRGVLKL